MAGKRIQFRSRERGQIENRRIRIVMKHISAAVGSSRQGDSDPTH